MSGNTARGFPLPQSSCGLPRGNHSGAHRRIDQIYVTNTTDVVIHANGHFGP